MPQQTKIQQEFEMLSYHKLKQQKENETNKSYQKLMEIQRLENETIAMAQKYAINSALGIDCHDLLSDLNIMTIQLSKASI